MIHRFWVGPPPAYDHRPELAAHHPGEEIVDWTPDTLPVGLRLFLRFTDDPRRTSNLIRYGLLYRFGGLWVDHDLEARAPLTDSARPWTASVGSRREGCALWFPRPWHPMMAEAIDETTRTPDAVGADILTLLAYKHPDVGAEPRILGGGTRALATHHWATSKAGR